LPHSGKPLGDPPSFDVVSIGANRPIHRRLFANPLVFRIKMRRVDVLHFRPSSGGKHRLSLVRCNMFG
jgi:hypothetical protein